MSHRTALRRVFACRCGARYSRQEPLPRGCERCSRCGILLPDTRSECLSAVCLPTVVPLTVLEPIVPCPQCGVWIGESATCHACDEGSLADDADAWIPCPTCGCENSARVEVCEGCGKNLDGPEKGRDMRAESDIAAVSAWFLLAAVALSLAGMLAFEVGGIRMLALRIGQEEWEQTEQAAGFFAGGLLCGAGAFLLRRIGRDLGDRKEDVRVAVGAFFIFALIVLAMASFSTANRAIERLSTGVGAGGAWAGG